MAALTGPVPAAYEHRVVSGPRSERSIGFERAWAEIPKSGAIPDKADFRPERFASFLNDIYLVELHHDEAKRVLFRLAGEHIRDSLGLDLRGHNYIDFVPDEHRETSGVSMKLMFSPRPCGRWVRKEIVHRDGFRERLDLTQFPMTDKANGLHLILGIAEGFGESFSHADGRFRFEHVDGEHFIDIGEGLPD